MRSKRGQAQMMLPPMFRAAVGFGAFLVILYVVVTIGSNEAYRRQLYITSLGLDLQSLQAIGEDINAERDITEAGEYQLVFESTQVYTRERGAQTSTFLFTQTPGLKFNAAEFIPEKTIGPIKLYKIGNEFGAEKPGKLPSKYTLTCGQPGTLLKTIALDPGHGYDGATSKGSTGENIISLQMRESAYTLRLANSLRARSTKFELTRAYNQDTHATLDARKNTPGDALISLHAGSREDDKEAVKAYYNQAPGSKELGCEILNEITAEFDVPVRLIPVNTNFLTAEDPKQVLNAARPAVLLEIGSAKKADSMLGKTSEIAGAIYRGVNNYGLG